MALHIFKHLLITQSLPLQMQATGKELLNLPHNSLYFAEAAEREEKKLFEELKRESYPLLRGLLKALLAFANQEKVPGEIEDQGLLLKEYDVQLRLPFREDRPLNFHPVVLIG